MDTVLQIRGINKKFGKKEVLQNIDLDIKAGEIFGIIGMSGAGKTTLLEILIGFITPDHGTMMFLPKAANIDLPKSPTLISVAKEPYIIKKTFGFATQEPSFYDKLTVEENLKYFASLYGIKQEEIEKKIDSILNFVDLPNEKATLAGELSGGMQKRLDIACSLVNDPKVLILDEPTADLDPISRKHIWDLIKRINKEGSTIIIASHFLEEMDVLCDRIAWLHNKTVIHRGTPDELRKRYTQNKEIHLETESAHYEKLIKHLKSSSIKKIITKPPKLILFTDDAEKALKKLLQAIDYTKETIVSVNVAKPSLDEVFESIVKK